MSAENPFSQIHEQYEAGKKASLLVRRTPTDKYPEGWISTARFTGKKQADTGLFQVEVSTPEGPSNKFVSEYRMSDAGQAELAEELGATRAESQVPGTSDSTYNDDIDHMRVTPARLEELRAELAEKEQNREGFIEMPDWVKRDIGQDALNMSGIMEPAPEVSQLDKLFDEMPILRTFETDIKRIAAVRQREEDEGYRHGMNQFVTSKKMIDDLIALMYRVEKPKTMSEDRRGAIYRYIDLV